MSLFPVQISRTQENPSWDLALRSEIGMMLSEMYWLSRAVAKKENWEEGHKEKEKEKEKEEEEEEEEEKEKEKKEEEEEEEN